VALVLQRGCALGHEDRNEEGAVSKDEGAKDRSDRHARASHGHDTHRDRDAEERRSAARGGAPVEPLAARPVHTRVAFGAEGDVAVHETVFCNLGERSVTLDACRGCSRFSVVTGAAGSERKVLCRAVGSLGLRLGDLGERSTRTVLSELGKRRFACVKPDASLDTIESLLLGEGEVALPVIDDAGRPLGMVSKTDLLRRYSDGVDEVVASELPHAMHADLRVAGTAGDIMTPLVHALPEDAPLSFGIALLAIEEIGQVPIVDDAGAVVGLFTANDAVRWLALEMGYVVKPPGS